MTVVSPRRATETRGRIVRVAARLLAEGGRPAVSTRAVCAEAGVQSPTIYRLFGDMQGLLDVVAEYGFALHLQDKASLRLTDDPVADLRAGWDHHIEFALANPALYALVYGELRSSLPPAATAAADVLAGYVHRVAEAGRLRMAEEPAAQLIAATGRGVALTLINLPAGARDGTLSHDAREAMIAVVTTESGAGGPVGPATAAISLRAVAGQATALSERERALLDEWLQRMSTPAGPGAG